MKLEIKESENIFDAILRSTGSVELALEYLVSANDSDAFDWNVVAGDEIETGTDVDLDFVVLDLFKKNGFSPSNTIGSSVDPITEFVDPNALDADVRLFVDAANLIDESQITAIDNFVLGLKSNNLWSKMVAIYPYVGGTLASHKFNLKDPRDADDAFRLNFVGDWIHDNFGVVPNGSDCHADTFLIPSNEFASGDNYSYGLFITDNPDVVSAEIGANETFSNFLWTRSYTETYLFIAGGAGINTNLSPYKGLISMSRTDNLSTKLYLNGDLKNNSVSYTGAAGAATCSFYIGARNDSSTPSYFSAKRQKLTYFSHGLTNAEMSIFAGLVTAYEIELSRNT